MQEDSAAMGKKQTKKEAEEEAGGCMKGLDGVCEGILCQVGVCSNTRQSCGTRNFPGTFGDVYRYIQGICQDSA